MNWMTLAGDNWIAWILNGTAILLTLFLGVLTLLSVFYCQFFYKRAYRPTYDRSYRPQCSVILPVKGICKNFETNLRSFCALDYDRYELLIAVESEDDPAVPAIRAIASADSHVKLVIAGFTKTCAQKNFNSLAAIRAANNPEVLVFGDADIAPEKQWLHELVIPLSDPDLPATTGFRWLFTKDPGIQLLTHANINIFMLALFGSASLFKIGSILWGGTMAIRKKDFDALNVAEKWNRSSVDDFSLSQVLFLNGKHSILVPECITFSDDLIETTKGSVNWFARQIMFLKAHHLPLWYLLGAMIVIGTLFVAWLPVSIVLSFFLHKSIVDLGGTAILYVFLGDAVGTLLYPLLGPIPGFWRYPLLQPFHRLTHLAAYLKTFVANSIVWAGIKYTIGRNGDVTKVERLK